MSDEMCYNSARMVTDLSNDTSIGWRMTGDHRFKVARYSQLRLHQGLDEQDWSKNRSNARIEHDVLVSYNGQNVPTSLVLKMADIVKQRQIDINSGKNINFQNSRQQLSRDRKITSDDINVKRQSKSTHPEDPHYLLPSNVKPHMSGKACIPRYDGELADKIILDTTVFDHIRQVNSKMTKLERDDLRNKIIQSGEHKVLLLDQYNLKKNNKLLSNESSWDSELNFERGKSQKLANYKRDPSTILLSNTANADNIEYENYKLFSKESEQRRGNLSTVAYNPDIEIEEMNMDEAEIEVEHLTGPMGNKYMRNYMTTETSAVDQNYLQEVSARN
jgi:hypothetical protein